MGDPKSPGLPLADAPTRFGPRDAPPIDVKRRRRTPPSRPSSLGADEGRLLGPLPLVLVEDSLLDELPGLVVDRMGDVLIRPIRALPAGHRDEHPARPLDDLEPAD